MESWLLSQRRWRLKQQMKISIKPLLLVIIATLLLQACDKSRDEPAKPIVYSETPRAAQVKTYRVTVHPEHDPVMLVKEYQPLIDYVNEQLSGKFTLEIDIPADFKTFENSIETRETAFIVGNPWHVIEAIDRGYHVIATAGEASEFHGVILVRKDSGIRSPVDLKGRTVSYPSSTSLASGMMPQWYLENHGLDVRHDTTTIYVGNQESSIMSVYLRQSDAGATWPPPWRQFQADHPLEASKLTAIWETPSLVNNGIVARDDVPLDVQKQVQAIFLQMNDSPAGQAIIKNAGTGVFLPATDQYYDVVRKFIADFEKKNHPTEKH
jgi:phosphonate transport system substrate-binding protein